MQVKGAVMFDDLLWKLFPPGGDLLECHSYIDVRCNVGLPDQVFNK